MLKTGTVPMLMYIAVLVSLLIILGDLMMQATGQIFVKFRASMDRHRWPFQLWQVCGYSIWVVWIGQDMDSRYHILVEWVSISDVHTRLIVHQESCLGPCHGLCPTSVYLDWCVMVACIPWPPYLSSCPMTLLSLWMLLISDIVDASPHSCDTRADWFHVRYLWVVDNVAKWCDV